MRLVDKHNIIRTFLVALLLVSCNANKEDLNIYEADKLLIQAEEHPESSLQYKMLSDSAAKLAQRDNYIKGMQIAYANLADYYYAKRNTDSTEYFNQMSLNLLDEDDVSHISGRIWANVAVNKHRISSMDSAKIAFDKSLLILRTLKDSSQLQSVLNSYALYNWRKGNLDTAIIYFEEAKVYRQKLGNLFGYAASLNNLGTVYYQWSLYDRALENYFKSLEIRKEIEYDYGVSLVSTNIGLVYRDIGEFDKARQFFLEGLKYAQKAKSFTKIGYAIEELGELFRIQGKLDSAEHYYNYGLELFNKEGDRSGIMLTNIRLGTLYKMKNDFAKSEEYYLKALEISKKRSSSIRVAQLYLYLAQLYFELGKIDKSLSYVNSSLKLAEAIPKLVFIRDGRELRGKIYFSKGLYKKAYMDIQKFDSVKSKVFNTNLNRKIESMDTRYKLQQSKNKLKQSELEKESQKTILVSVSATLLALVVLLVYLMYTIRKRKKVNSQLREQNELINQGKLELEKSNQTKQKLFSILAHDIKNPFQALNGYSEMLLSDYYELTDEERQNYLNEISLTSLKLTDLLDNMVDWSASQTGDLKINYENVDLCEITSSVIELTLSQASKKNVKIVNKIEKCYTVRADKYMLQVVLRNLLTNAIKFSYKNSEVIISAIEKEDETIVSVSDTGTGIDKEILNKLFGSEKQMSSVGTSGEAGTGLGLFICKEFIEQNGGRIWVDSEKDKGSTFSFSILNG